MADRILTPGNGITLDEGTAGITVIDADVNAADLAAKASLASPTFTGTPAAPTATAGTNTTQLATTAFVTAAVAASGGGGALAVEDQGIEEGTGIARLNFTGDGVSVSVSGSEATVNIAVDGGEVTGEDFDALAVRVAALDGIGAGSPHGTHLYWRLYVTSNHGGGITGVGEVEMRAIVGGADQCTGGTPSASSEYGGFPATSAFDDNAATGWFKADAASLPQWLRYQFSAPVSVAQVMIQPLSGQPASYFVNAVDVQYSDDGSSWTTAWSLNTTNPPDGSAQTFTDPEYVGPDDVLTARVADLEAGPVTAGDHEVTDNAKGLILKSPDGTRYRVKVANGGTLTVTAV